MNLVVVGIAPTVDTSVATGPFRSWQRASAADAALVAKGYVTEIVELAPVAEIDAANETGTEYA